MNERPSMSRILIIGYGNPLRGDDRLGWFAAERLEQLPELVEDRTIEIITCHQLTPELAEAVSQVKLVIFIDAAAQGTPGTVKCESLNTDPTQPDTLGHHFTPARVLAYAHAIFGGTPRAVVVSVAVESFELGEQLSQAVEAALPTVVERVLGIMQTQTS